MLATGKNIYQKKKKERGTKYKIRADHGLTLLEIRKMEDLTKLKGLIFFFCFVNGENMYTYII